MPPSSSFCSLLAKDFFSSINCPNQFIIPTNGMLFGCGELAFEHIELRWVSKGTSVLFQEATQFLFLPDDFLLLLLKLESLFPQPS